MSSIAATEKRAAELLKRLVEIPSVSGFEAQISDFVAEWIEKIGFVAQKHEVYKTGSNVVVKLGKGNRVLLCGHLDVVPELDMVDAFKPRLVDGELYGRGACDMKGGVAAMLMTLEMLRNEENEPDATFAFVVDEEMHGRGAAELMRRGVRADVCIITEPSNNKICVGNASCIEFRLVFHGQSGHGASRIAANAVKFFTTVYDSLERRLTDVFTVESERYPMKPIVNIGRVEGGFGAWVVPSKVSMDILVHTHPSITYEHCVKILRSVLDEIGRDYGVDIDFISLHGCDGFLLDEDSRYITMLKQALRKVNGRNPETGVFEAETDGNALYHKGGQPCVVFGPGDIRYAHSSREHIKVADVVQTAKTLTEFLKAVTT